MVNGTRSSNCKPHSTSVSNKILLSMINFIICTCNYLLIEITMRHDWSNICHKLYKWHTVWKWTSQEWIPVYSLCGVRVRVGVGQVCVLPYRHIAASGCTMSVAIVVMRNDAISKTGGMSSVELSNQETHKCTLLLHWMYEKINQFQSSKTIRIVIHLHQIVKTFITRKNCKSFYFITFLFD